MKKRYESTLEEATETSIRLAEMTGMIARQRWQSLMFAPFAFPAFYLLLWRQEMSVRLWSAGFMTLVVAVASVLAVKDQIRRNINRSRHDARRDRDYTGSCL